MLGLLLGAVPAHGRAIDRADAPTLGEFRRYAHKGPVVDGIPVILSIELQIWTGIEWVPVGSDDGRRAKRRLPPLRYPRE